MCGQEKEGDRMEAQGFLVSLRPFEEGAEVRLTFELFLFFF